MRSVNYIARKRWGCCLKSLAKKSRNIIGNELLETAIELVRNELSEEVLSNLDSQAMVHLLEMQADTTERQMTAE